MLYTFFPRLFLALSIAFLLLGFMILPLAPLLAQDEVEGLMSEDESSSKDSLPLRDAKLLLLEKMKSVWKWQEAYAPLLEETTKSSSEKKGADEDGTKNEKKLEEVPASKKSEETKTEATTEKKTADATPNIKKEALPQSQETAKILALIQKAKNRSSSIFDGKWNAEKETALLAAVNKDIEKVQLIENFGEKIQLIAIAGDLQDFTTTLDQKMENLNPFGLPEEVWKECRYNHQGMWLLDMTSPYWQKLTVQEQKEYARIYWQGYANFLGKSPEENFRKDNLSLILVLIPPGRFWMGSPADEKGRKSDEKRHRVIVGQPYYIGKYEVTQKQWYSVMSTTPSHFLGDNLPVEQVSWYDCQRFCAKVGLRLPTEAEWEYACRSGTTSAFHSGSTITAGNVNYNGYPYLGDQQETYRAKTTEIADLTNGNAWRCFDFHGNVWEWCYDWYSEYPQEDVVDPVGTWDEMQRVSRGGGWSGYASDCRSASRSQNEPGFRFIYLGFRVAASVNTVFGN